MYVARTSKGGELFELKCMHTYVAINLQHTVQAHAASLAVLAVLVDASESMLLRHCSWEPSLVHGHSTGGEGVRVSPYLNVSTGQAPCYWSTLQEGWSLLPWAARQ